MQEAIQHTEHQIQVMILRQAEAGMSVQDLYARQIEIAGEQLASQKKRYEALGYEAQERTNQTQQRQQVFKIIAAEPDFWQGDALAINQRLTRFCGNYRLFIRDGEIEDFRPL